jgi:hypothetical protein
LLAGGTAGYDARSRCGQLFNTFAKAAMRSRSIIILAWDFKQWRRCHAENMAHRRLLGEFTNFRSNGAA